MRFLLAIAVLASTFSGFAQGTSEAIIRYTNNAVASVSGTVGWTFQTSESIAATDLGCFAYVFANNPSVAQIQVGLWNEIGTLLASRIVTSGSSLTNDTRYESISPVALDPGQTYRIGAYYAGGNLGFRIAGPLGGGGISNAPAILLGGMARGGAGFSSPVPIQGTPGSIYAVPNFRFDVPEPCSWLLLSLGGLLLAARRRHQRR
jgi:hypothetical protein